MSALPPAPKAWVNAAKARPMAQERLNEIVERAKADEDYRRRVVANPETALEEADVVVHSKNVEIIRRRLDEKKDE